MQRPSFMLTRLNAETRALHRDADAPWIALMSDDVTAARYLDHLVTVYGFEAPIEAALALTPHIGTVLRLRERARSGRVVQDLLSLGLTPSKIARLPQCGAITMFRDRAEALGWSYVVERATLLQHAILRHFGDRLPSAYLSAYEGVVGARWQALGVALDRIVETSFVADQIVNAACDAFTCQRDWYFGGTNVRARRA